MGSRAKEDKKLPESGFLALVGSGAKEENKLPGSGLLILVVPDQRRIRTSQSLVSYFTDTVFRSNGG